MKKRSLFLRVVSLTVLAAWFPGVCLSQINRSSLTGVVTDPSGAVVLGAAIVLVEERTQVKYESTTNDAGAYTFSALPLGAYRLTVTASSFKTLVRSGIELSAGDNKRIDVSLELGEVTQQVEVTGAAPVLETDEPVYSNTIATKTLEKLPILLPGLKRDASNYLATVPGYQGGAGFTNNINGSIGTFSELYVDGVPADGNPAVHGLFRNGFSNETLAEFKVADTPSADQGPTGGALISFVSKSGTNEFHGAFYEYHRNTSLTARDFFSPSVPTNLQNEYGFTVGGPVWIPRVYDGRNKTFFFFNWGQSKRRYGVGAATYTMPIEAFKQGDFSRLLGPVVGTDALGRPVREGQIYDPGTTRPDGRGGFIRDPFDGNIIPSGRFSQVSQNFQSYYPTLPAGAPLVNNYLTSGGSGAQDEDYYDIKADQQIGKNRFAGKFWRSYNTTADPFNLPEIFAIRTSSFSRGSHGRFNWTRPISARWVNDFAFGIDRDFLSTSSPGDAGIGASLIGQPNALGRCLPTIQIAGIFSTTQTELKCGQNEADTNWRFTNNTSYSAGKHLIKFGGIYNSWAANFPIENNALFTFLSPETGLPGQFLTDTGYPYASFLLGGVDSAAAKGAEDQTPRMYTVGVYVQDSWRVRPNLTLQLGLRWDVQPFPVHWKDTISQFDATVPNPGAGGRLGALTYAGTGPGRIGKRRLAPFEYTNFGPRIGFAYQAGSKTVIRGNWGLYYGPTNQTMAGFAAVIQQGYFPTFSRASLDGFSAPFNWDQGFPLPASIEPTFTPDLVNGSDTAFFGPDAGRAPRIQMVHFGVQHELPGKLLLEASFIGKYAYGLISGSAEPINQLDYGRYASLGDLLTADAYSPQAQAAGISIPYAGFQGTVAQALRPFPQYLTINNEGAAVSYNLYNSFQLKLQKHYANGLSFLMGYTISKALTDVGGIGNIPGFFASSPQDAYNRRAEKSLANTDIPQSLLFHYLYELPVGPGKKFLNQNNIFTKYIVGGWSIAGVHSYNSGTPIGVTTQRVLPTMGSALLGNSLRPDRVPDLPIRTDVSCGDYDPGRGDRYLNVSAFRIPAPWTFGNVSKTLGNVRTCGSLNENISIRKMIPIKETVSFQFGGDFFNAFNRHNWGGPGADVSNPAAFGTITSTGAGRVIQVYARFEW
jgi:Carboxypeptidase regulatory-like domain